MGFLDDLQRGAENLTSSVKGTVDDTQARYRADALLHDYGLLIFRQQTGAPLPDDAAQLERVWTELHAHLGLNPTLVLALKTTVAPPPPPPGAAPPPPPPGSEPASRRAARCLDRSAARRRRPTAPRHPGRPRRPRRAHRPRHHRRGSPPPPPPG